MGSAGVILQQDHTKSVDALGVQICGTLWVCLKEVLVSLNDYYTDQ